MTNAQSGYNDLFSSWFLKSRFPFSQGWLNLEEFIMDVHVLSLLPFCVKEFTDCRFQIDDVLSFLRETGLYQKYDELKLVNHVQTNEILVIENFTY